MKVQTGRVIGGGLRNRSAGDPAPKGNVLFDARSDSVYSRVFCISNGYKKLISAYGIYDDDRILIYKLVMQPGQIKSVCDTDCNSCFRDELATAPTVLYTKTLKDCDEEVTMHTAQDELSLPGPGCYRLAFSDASMLGRVYVEFQDLAE